jgi:hypothetical protein
MSTTSGPKALITRNTHTVAGYRERMVDCKDLGEPHSFEVTT